MLSGFRTAFKAICLIGDALFRAEVWMEGHMKVLQINSVFRSSSTGKIAVCLYDHGLSDGHEVAAYYNADENMFG